MDKGIIRINDKSSRGELNVSSLKEFNRKSFTENPSVKIVLSGKEHYSIDGRVYLLGKNQFLVIDKQSSEELTIDANQEVKGICVYPNKDLLYEVAKTRLSSLEDLLERPFDYDEIKLMHNQYNLAENKTGKFLQQQIPFITQFSCLEEPLNLNSFMTGLAECLIDDQLELEGKLKRITTVKRSTKEELYRRVASVKNYITDNYTYNISLDELAKEAFLSKYHFIRTFKEIYRLSPFQFLLQLRLQKAQELLAKDYSYNETCILVGFSDEKNLRKSLKKFSKIGISNFYPFP